MKRNFNDKDRLPFGEGGKECVAPVPAGGWCLRTGNQNGVYYTYLVTVNGKVQRASYDVKVGDILALHFGARTLKVEVITVADNVSEADAAAMYREVSE